MKQVRAFHPVLYAAFPILAVFSANSALFPATQLIRPLLISVGLAVTVWIVIGTVWRDWNRSAIATSALILSFYSFDWLFGWMIEDELTVRVLVAWGVFSISLSAFAAWKFRWHRFANILSVCLCLVSAGPIAYTSIRKLNIKPKNSAGTRFAGSEMPDIVYVVLDGYGRTDQLERVVGYSDQWFVDELANRGFYIAKRSHSNYSQTDLSLASTLNMETVQNLFPNADVESNDRLPLYRLIDDNRVAKELRQLGYTYVGVRSGYPGIRFEFADYVPQAGPRTTLFEATILQLTPLRASTKTVGSMFDSRRRDLLRAIQHLRDLSAPSAAPRFVIAHILAPHPPFVLGANGEPIRPKGAYGLFDGSHFMKAVGDETDYKRGYAGQAEYIAKEILTGIDLFISRARVRPIIIIQGDHGSKVHLDQDSLEKTDVQECFAILNAFLVPDDVKQSLYPEISSVNTFRLLLSSLFHKDLPLLEDRNYYSPSDRPFELTEVTKGLEQTKLPTGAVTQTGG